MKALKILLFFLVGLIFVSAGLTVWYFKHVAPSYSGEIRSVEISNETIVTFDSLGIPHISAQNEGDAYFALGYVQASERLFQMELLRRIGSGRLSEILGKDLIPVDRFFRAMNLGKGADLAAAGWDTIQEPWVHAAQQYLKGVNAFIDEQPAPVEFLLMGIPATHFTPRDMYLISGYMAFSFAEALRSDPILSGIESKLGGKYLEIFGIHSGIDGRIPTVAGDQKLSLLPVMADRVFSLLPVAPWLGSNGWVVSGKHTPDGKPLFANDTHIGYQQPAVWYEASIRYPGFQLYGHYLAGLPFPLTGHTTQHAWGLTMFENDDMNLYSERLQGNRYQNGQELRELLITTNTILVKGQAPDLFKVRYTHRGPLVSDLIPHLPDSGESEYSLWWSYPNLPATALPITYSLSHANTLEVARAAAAAIHAPGLNILYCNTRGDIACWSAGRIPLIGQHPDTRKILDGASGNFDVIGYLDFAYNPQTENPPSGIIVTANEDHHTFGPDSSLIYGYYAPDDRYNRICSLLNSKSSWKPNDFMSIQTDAVSDVQLRNAALLVEVLQADAAADPKPEALKALSNWKGTHQTGDTAPTIWYATLAFILRNAMQDELGEFHFDVFVNTHVTKTATSHLLHDAASPWWDDVSTPSHIETRAEIFSRSYAEAVKWLEETYGKTASEWSWGKQHTLTHAHPAGAVKPLGLIFNVGPYPAPGGIETINNAGFPMHASSNFPVKYGPAMRNIISMRDPANGWSAIPSGQSGHRGSPHYSDQAVSYVQGQYRSMTMNLPEQASAAATRLRFIPKQ